MKGKILVTGFEAFGGHDVNPSGDIAMSLDGFEVSGYRVVSALLPVEWGSVKSRMEALISEIQPVAILSLGLAAGRTEVSVEKVAVNYTSQSKDNVGAVPEERSIIQGAPDGYFATIPAEEIAEEMRQAGIPARLSLSAGAYLCNYAFYCASHLAKQRASDIQVGFIHIPATPEMTARSGRGGASMELERIKRAVGKALTTIVLPFQNVGGEEGFL